MFNIQHKECYYQLFSFVCSSVISVFAHFRPKKEKEMTLSDGMNLNDDIIDLNDHMKISLAYMIIF